MEAARAKTTFQIRPAEPSGFAVSPRVVREMERLYTSGFSLVPLGEGPDGKAATMRFKGAKRLPLAAVLRQMRANMYGIRLDGLVVVDVDTDTREAAEYVKARFGEAEVQVQTARGVHHYYRRPAGKVPTAPIRLSGISIDIKTGPDSYVVGPHSERPDIGIVYEPLVGDLSRTRPGVLVDRQPSTSVPVGRRNDTLFHRALKYVHLHDDEAEFRAELIAQRNYEFDDAATFPDSEVDKISRSVWRYKLERTLWGGRNSTYRVNNRMLLDRLVPAGENDAFVLYHLLAANHGHLNRPFLIAPDAMIKAGLWGKGRDTLYKARDVLLAEGLIVRDKGYTFRLTEVGHE